MKYQLSLIIAALLISNSEQTSLNSDASTCSLDFECNGNSTTSNEYCCGMRSCQETDTIYSHSRRICMKVSDHLKVNKTNGEFCSYNCQIQEKSCITDSDCSSPFDCCSTLQKEVDMEIVGAYCVRKDLSEIFFKGQLHYVSCMNSSSIVYSRSICAASMDCQQNFDQYYIRFIKGDVPLCCAQVNITNDATKQYQSVPMCVPAAKKRIGGQHQVENTFDEGKKYKYKVECGKSGAFMTEVAIALLFTISLILSF